MSTTFSSGFVGVSTQISRVSGRTRALQRVEVGLVDHVVLEAEAREHLVHEPVGAAVEVERQDHVVARGAVGGEQGVGGGHAAREGGAVAALELAERALERRARGVRGARVVVVLDELARRGLHVGRGLVDRRDHGAERRVGVEARVHHAGRRGAALTAPATRAGPPA